MGDGPMILPELPSGWEETRATLHAYARGIGVIPRAHAGPHPKWWHVSFAVTERGLETEEIALPGGGSLSLLMDLEADEVVLSTSGGEGRSFDMSAGLTGTEFGEELIAAVAAHGLEGEYERARFENDEARQYSSSVASTMMRVFVDVAGVFETHRAEIGGQVGPVQLWPHGFDIAFEWFGTRIERYEEDGEVEEHPAQLNLGFYPGGEPYFYSNPWPFEGDKLMSAELPHGAAWHTDGWPGTILPYDKLVGDPHAEDKLLEYAMAVYELAAPTLTA